MTKETIEKIIRNNRSGIAAHQIFTEVERLTKENEVQSHEIRLISDHRDQLLGERDEARARAEAWEIVYDKEWKETCVHHTDSERAYSGCPVCNRAALDTAQEETKTLRAQLAEREEDRKRLGKILNDLIPDADALAVDLRNAANGYGSGNLNTKACLAEHILESLRAAIRSARGATPEGTPQEGAAGQVATEAEEKPTPPKGFHLIAETVSPLPEDALIKSKFFCSDSWDAASFAGEIPPHDYFEQWWVASQVPSARDDCAAPDRGAQEEGR